MKSHISDMAPSPLLHTTAPVTTHSAGDSMPRHRHSSGYAAVVLEGGYIEAGDYGRAKIAAGDVIIHCAYEAHRDEFLNRGAKVLNLPLPEGLGAGVGSLDDVDALARLAEKDVIEATQMLAATFRPLRSLLNDWPDRLASMLMSRSDLRLVEWADRMGIAPQSLSRGFRKAYGVSPKRFQAEHRALRAVRSIPGWGGTLAGLAVELGFSDQAHLSRAVRMITGQTPTRFRVQSVQDRTAAS